MSDRPTGPASALSRARHWLARRRARRAALRADHVAALSGVGGDCPEVLGRLGLHLDVLERAPDARTWGDGLAVAIAHAETGAAAEAIAAFDGLARQLGPADRLRFALALGRWAPTEALRRLPEGEPLAALALRAWQREALAPEQVMACAASPRRLADRAALASRCAAGQGRHALARTYLNDLLALHGLPPAVEAGAGGPLDLEALQASVPAVAHGPLVTVVMPAREAAPTIASAVRSVLRQSWRRLELIVVDDASRDGTVAAALSAAEGDPRLRLLRQPIAMGAYAARNRGLEAASGEIIAFNDADDWSHPCRIALSVAALSTRRGRLAVLSRLVRLEAGGLLGAPRIFPLVRANPASLVLLRRPVLDRLGGFEAVATGADEELIGRLVACFGPSALVRLPQPLTVASLRSGSLTMAAAGGIVSREGVVARLAYRQAWMRGHVERVKAAGGFRGQADWRVATQAPIS